MAKNIKGRKFVATAASAALVASAIVPVASAAEFADQSKISDWAADAVAHAVEKGYMKGANGNFNPQGTITKAELAQVLYNALELSPVTDAPFTDVPADAWYATAVNAIAAEGITNGDGNGKFAPTKSVTLAEAANLIVKALGLTGEADLSKFADASTVPAWANSAIQALVAGGYIKGNSNNGVLTLGANDNLSRERLATFFVSVAVDTIEKEEAGEVTAIKSVSAINAKTIEVKFDGAVKDTSKATIELLRGTFKQNFTQTWSEDKTSVTLTAASNLQAAEYVVKVSGVTEEVLTGTVKVEAQRVESIEILGSVLVAKGDPTANGFTTGDEATVTYSVKDQYGTEMKNYSLKTNNDADVVASNGVLTVKGSVINGKKIGDLIPVVLIDTTSGKSTTATLTLSAKSTVTEIGFAGVFNTKGEAVELNDASKVDSAYLVLDLKDQYGKEITKKASATGLTFRSTNTNNLTIDESTLHELKINGEDKLVVKFTKFVQAGETDILFISTTNGKSATYKVSVAATAVVDTVVGAQPELAVQKEDVLIPLTVADKAGNLITDRDLVVSAKGIKVNDKAITKSDLVVKDGQLYLKKNFEDKGPNTLIFTSSTFKVSTLTIDVKEAVKATTIRGFKNPLILSTVNGVKTIKPSDVIIEDQYGRVIPAGHTAASSEIKVSLAESSDVVSVGTSNDIKPLKNGTATLKIELKTPNGNIDSSVEQTVRVTNGTEYSDYKIEEFALTQVDKATDLVVSGLLNGGEVELSPSEYTVSVSGGKINASTDQTTIYNSSTDQLTFDASLLKDSYQPDGTTVAVSGIDTEFTVKVTINATGKVLEQKITVSKAPSVIQEVFFTTSAAVTTPSSAEVNAALANAVTAATIVEGSTVASLKSTDDVPATVNVVTVDQYGNKSITAISATTVTIVPEKAGEVEITGNGTASAIVKLRDGVTKSNVTYKIVIGKATVEIPVLVIKQV